MRAHLIHSFPLFILCVFVFTFSVSAQQLWVIKERGTTVSGEYIYVPIRIDHPDDTVGTGYKKYLSTFVLGVTIKAGKGWLLKGEMPVQCSYITDKSADKYHINFGGGSKPTEYGSKGSSVGNPYIGFEHASPESDVYMEFGGRVPLVSDNNEPFDAFALDIAALGDIDRPGAYSARGVPVSGAVTWEPAIGRTQHRAHVRGGVAIAGRTYSHLYAGADFSFDLVRLQFGYSLLGEYRGLDADPEYRSELGASFCMPIGAIRPGFALRFPLDKERMNRIDAAYNFYVSVVLPENKKTGT